MIEKVKNHRTGDVPKARHEAYIWFDFYRGNQGYAPALFNIREEGLYTHEALVGILQSLVDLWVYLVGKEVLSATFPSEMDRTERRFCRAAPALSMYGRRVIYTVHFGGDTSTVGMLPRSTLLNRNVLRRNLHLRWKAERRFLPALHRHF